MLIKQTTTPVVLRQHELPAGTEVKIVGSDADMVSVYVTGHGIFQVPADVLEEITPEMWADKAICAEALNLTERADFCWQQTNGQWAPLKVVCSLCEGVITNGPPNKVSNTICRDCLPAWARANNLGDAIDDLLDSTQPVLPGGVK